MARANGKDFWERMLSGNKVKRILENQGVDTNSFRIDYESDTSRPHRVPVVPSTEEIEAVEDFMQTGDYSTFTEVLGVKSRVGADSTLRRVLVYQASHDSVKAIEV